MRLEKTNEIIKSTSTLQSALCALCAEMRTDLYNIKRSYINRMQEAYKRAREERLRLQDPNSYHEFPDQNFIYFQNTPRFNDPGFNLYSNPEYGRLVSAIESCQKSIDKLEALAGGVTSAYEAGIEEVKETDKEIGAKISNAEKAASYLEWGAFGVEVIQNVYDYNQKSYKYIKRFNKNKTSAKSKWK